LQTSRNTKKKNPSMEFRHYPLAAAVSAVEKQARVVVLASHPLTGSSEAPLCLCGEDDDVALITCKKCRTEYHQQCIQWNPAGRIKAKDYVCGFCLDEPDDDGVRYWHAPICADLADLADDNKIHRNDNELMYQGRGKLRKRIGGEQQVSWANVIDRVHRQAIKVHELKKAQYDRAKARIAEGGHHVADRAGGGGVAAVPVDDQVVDFLEGIGEI